MSNDFFFNIFFHHKGYSNDFFKKMIYYLNDYYTILYTL